MKRILTIVSVIAVSAQMALAGEPAQELRRKLDQARQAKVTAMAAHQLEAELIKEARRSTPSVKPAPQGKPAQLAAQN